jgi:hypothetical protein
MVPLDLNERERELLVEILEGEAADLRSEIAHTERLAYRTMLKERRAIVEKALDALRAPAMTG